jgi:hypothetical protein
VKRTLASLVVIGGLTLAGTAPASAAGTTTAATVKARAHAAIERRLATLADLRSRVTGQARLTSGDRGQLLTQIDADSRGLTALDAKIQADTDRATLRTDVEAIVVDYRVYLLTVPKVHEVIAADTELAAVTRLDAIAARLQAAIDAARAHGHDTTRAQADLDAMKAKVAAADGAAAPVPGQVLPLTPPNWATADRPVLEAARTSLVDGRADLAAARDLAHQVVADLRS